MTDPAEKRDEQQPAAPPKPKRKYVRRKARTKAQVMPFQAPDEFAGMTERDCCAACLENTAAAEQAQKRMNEIDCAYPRAPSMLPSSPTVMEGDAEWLKRNPGMAEEWQRLSKAAMGKCSISGAPGCHHPFKNALPPHLMRDPKVFAKWNRARKLLQHRKIDLRGD